MTGLGEQYSRGNFENAADATPLAASLAELLTSRLRRAEDARSEARILVRELKALGHELFSWDESTDCETWGDDYSRPKAKRLLVELSFPEDNVPSASVEFGPWPAPEPAISCPRCHMPMSATFLCVRGVGHGHGGSREVNVEVSLGETHRRTFSAGQASRGLQVPGFWCSSCAGLWLPDTTRIGWT
jgi:hypothetical protein